MASLDVHEFSCSIEAVQNFNKIILETAKESVPFKLRKKPHHKRKYNKKNYNMKYHVIVGRFCRLLMVCRVCEEV